MLLHQGRIEGCSLTTFETVTGLSLTTDEGGLRDELPPITTWLNRLLALRIETQNLLFEVFEDAQQMARDAHKRYPFIEY